MVGGVSAAVGGGCLHLGDGDVSITSPWFGGGGGGSPALGGVGFPWGLAFLPHVSLLSFEAGHSSWVLVGSGTSVCFHLPCFHLPCASDLKQQGGWKTLVPLQGGWGSQEPQAGGVSVGRSLPPPAPLCLQVPMTLKAQLILKWFYKKETDGSQPPYTRSCQYPMALTFRPQQHSPEVPAQILHGSKPHPRARE